MPTSLKKMAPKSRPVVRFFLAEDIRQEVAGKVSAIGLYADNVVVLQLSEDVPDPTLDGPMMIRSLAFLFSVSGLGKASSISVDLQSNGARKPFMARRRFPPSDPGNSVNLLGVMSPCFVTSFGTKTAIVDIAGVEHIFEFEFRRAPMPESSAQTNATKIDTPSSELRRARRKIPTAKIDS